MTSIFISYSHADSSVTRKLADLLRESYDDVWYDPDIPGGEEWWKTIEDKIHTHDLFIFLISPESLVSEYCQKELRLAQSEGKCIIPIVVRANAQVPEDLNSIQLIQSPGDITVDSLNNIYKAIIRNSEPILVSLDEKSLHADLRLLQNIWPLINSAFIHKLTMAIYKARVVNDDLVDYLWMYSYHRQKPENTFISDILETAFSSFDEICSRMEASISAAYRVTTIEGTVYRESNQDSAHQDVLLSLNELKLRHKALVRVIKSIFPDFDFARDQKGQQRRDKLASLLQRLRKIQQECGVLLPDFPNKTSEYFSLISNAKFVCEEASVYDVKCPAECLQVKIGFPISSHERMALEERCRYYLLYIARVRLIVIPPWENFNAIEPALLSEYETRNRNALNDAITSLQRIIEVEKPYLARKENIFTLYENLLS